MWLGWGVEASGTLRQLYSQVVVSVDFFSVPVSNHVPLCTHTRTHTQTLTQTYKHTNTHNANTHFFLERQWTYQTCTEFGYFQTTDSEKTSLFSHGIGLDFYMDICTDVFDILPENLHNIENRTNHFYGGRNVTGTNIVFPNGSIDPWHALSVLTDIGSTVHARYITGTAHCANMYPPRDSDLQELTAAREEISALIGQWLGTGSK